jgi:hypothetical protein
MIRGNPISSKMALAVLGLAALAAVLGGAPAASGTVSAPAVESTGAGASPASPSPVVVELYTAQGCSSCPPADRLLTRLLRDPKIASEVIPLAFHVDYWDHQGWVDPFSSHDWTVRQEGYAQAFRADKIYTPQMVVNGRTECNASQEGDVRQRINQGLGDQNDAVVSLDDVTVASPPTKSADGSVRVKVAAHLSRKIPAAGLDLWVAVTQNGLVTAVKGGENASATLHDDHVVRKMVKAFTLQPTPGPAQTAEIDLPLARGGDLSSFAVVAFAQDPGTRIIDGAAMRQLGH